MHHIQIQDESDLHALLGDRCFNLYKYFLAHTRDGCDDGADADLDPDAVAEDIHDPTGYDSPDETDSDIGEEHHGISLILGTIRGDYTV